MNVGDSYRHVLRATSVLGGASLVGVLLGLVRMKGLALVAGPSGVGLVGLFSSVVAAIAMLGGLGVGDVGGRQIAVADATGDAEDRASARQALAWATLFLAIVASTAAWALRGELATLVFHDPSMGGDVGWLALGTGLTILNASQAAFLSGMRRVGELAKATAWASLVSTALSLGALCIWRDRALLVFVIAGPLVGFVVMQIFVSRVPSASSCSFAPRRLFRHWMGLVRLGSAVMGAGLIAALAPLIVRALVERRLGEDALGHFQAAWTISMTYIGFLFQAMGLDYYARLATVRRDLPSINRMVNLQTEIALMLAAPVLLAVLGLSPWLIELLYSARFGEANSMLRWQILGDALKVASWPLGFILLVVGDGRNFLLAELAGFSIYAGVSWLGLSAWGLESTGFAFLIMYVFYLPTIFWLSRRHTGLIWSVRVGRQLFALLAAVLVVIAIASWRLGPGACAGVLLAVLFGMHALSRLALMSEVGGQIGKMGQRYGELLVKLTTWKV